MKYEDIPLSSRYKYEQKCPCCQLITSVLTQRDNYPEYITEIFIMCMCGEYLELNLPVN